MTMDGTTGQRPVQALPSGRMGKAAEYLVAATCILASRGELNVSTSLVDDEGVDLVFNRRNSSAMLAVQVKARMSTSNRVLAGSFMAFVQGQTFRPRPGLNLLFVAIDIERGAIMTAWLVPSLAFVDAANEPSDQGRYRFYASMKPSGRDRWQSYRLDPSELVPRILDRLGELGEGDRDDAR